MNSGQFAIVLCIFAFIAAIVGVIFTKKEIDNHGEYVFAYIFCTVIVVGGLLEWASKLVDQIKEQKL